MRVIGVTGGIASGKSTVARRLSEHGARHVDADELARRAVEPGSEALERIRETFTDAVLTPDGTLDRAVLGRIVFGDPAARERLNAIVHPAVRRLAAAEVAEAERAGDEVVVYDVPLLVEGGLQKDMDLVVVVHAERSVRHDRLTRLRGLSDEEADARLDAQASDDERLNAADVVIDAGGTIEHTREQADRLWDTIQADVGGPS